MSSSIIHVEHLSKRYIIRHQRTKGDDGLRHRLEDFTRAPWRWIRKQINGKKIASPELATEQMPTQEEFWALKDVSFAVQQGEVLGIIGRNGAGKSTLLKILSRITEPTKGRIRMWGRVASLLEVGTGFHQELTGRENIFLNGAVLGMATVEIKRKFDEIVAFSGVEKFLDTPVKRYSSGMYVRLAFAVAAHLEPEILIVDEVLAVGDAAFQKKCLGRMRDVAGQGRTVLFVSHNMAAVRTLCSRSLLLESGCLNYVGEPGNTINHYLGLAAEKTAVDLAQRKDRLGNGKLRWTSVQFLNKDGNTVEDVVSGDEFIIQAGYQAVDSIDHTKMIISMSLSDEYGNGVVAFISDEMGTKFGPFGPSGFVRLRTPQLLLRGGLYSLKLFASCPDTHPESFYDSIENAAQIRVLPGDFWHSGKTNRSGNTCLIPGSFEN